MLMEGHYCRDNWRQEESRRYCHRDATLALLLRRDRRVDELIVSWLKALARLEKKAHANSVVAGFAVT